MSNNQIKKQAAEDHNRKRRELRVERARIEQDKIDNPEKYAMSKRNISARGKAQVFIATAMAISPNGFESRFLK